MKKLIYIPVLALLVGCSTAANLVITSHGTASDVIDEAQTPTIDPVVEAAETIAK